MDKDIIIPFYNTPQRQRLADSENGFILFQQTAADEKNGVEREGAHGHSSGVGGDFECHTPGKRGERGGADAYGFNVGIPDVFLLDGNFAASDFHECSGNPYAAVFPRHRGENG